MSKTDSIRLKSTCKPAKPYPNFPLCPHAKQWEEDSGQDALFVTQAGGYWNKETGDNPEVAVDHIIEHARDDMASVYLERKGGLRLKAVYGHEHFLPVDLVCRDLTGPSLTRHKPRPVVLPPSTS